MPEYRLSRLDAVYAVLSDPRNPQPAAQEFQGLSAYLQTQNVPGPTQELAKINFLLQRDGIAPIADDHLRVSTKGERVVELTERTADRLQRVLDGIFAPGHPPKPAPRVEPVQAHPGAHALGRFANGMRSMLGGAPDSGHFSAVLERAKTASPPRGKAPGGPAP